MAFMSSLRGAFLNGARSYSSCIGLNDVYVLSAVRTPIGCFQGKLSSFNAVQLATKALTLAAEKSCVAKEEIQEVVLGTAFNAGLGVGPAHQVALYSGLSDSVISWVLNKACASGMKAVMLGCQIIISQGQEVVAVGGMESSSNIPYILRRKRSRIGNLCVPDLIFHDGFTDSFHMVDVNTFGEEIAKEYNYSREDQDNYAVNSYTKAMKAQSDNVFAAEIVPIVLKTNKGEEIICHDEEVGRLNIEKMKQLKPETGKDGTITAANSSGLHDGAAAMILASGNYVLKKNLRPLAKIVSFGDGCLEPRKFVLAPSVAIPKVLVRANLKVDDICRWEISETFAVTPMVNSKLLKINPDQLNIYGGAISLGHPFGMTGARLIVHLAHTLPPGKLGCASISHGPGGASAIIIEKMS